MTIAAGTGVLELINRSVALDQLGLNMLSMMGLALGVDYGLVLVSRFREELASGHDPAAAVQIATATAGRAIAYAGVTLAAAMAAALLIAPGALLSSATFGVIVAVAFALITALVALPAALTLLGHSVNRWRLGSSLAGEARLGGLALRAIRRPGLAAAIVAALLVALTIPATTLESGAGDARLLPNDLRERTDFEQVRETLDGAWTSPYEVILAGPDGAAIEPRTLRALARWQARIANRGDVLAVLGPGDIGPDRGDGVRQRTSAMAARDFAINLDRGSSAAQLSVIPRDDPYETTRAGHSLRQVLENELTGLERRIGLHSAIGGPAPELQDFDGATSKRFWLMILVLPAVTFFILVVMLRAILAPLLAVALNLLTIGAAFGVLALLFGGPGNVLGDFRFVDGISMLAIFAVAFGLAIDYEVFILARVREGHSMTGNTKEAIAYGLRKTAHVITGGALIMSGVFVAFGLADLLTMRQIGIGLTVAVLLDATLVRLVLLPAAVRLLGEASWWLPVLPWTRGTASGREEPVKQADRQPSSEG